MMRHRSRTPHNSEKHALYLLRLALFLILCNESTCSSSAVVHKNDCEFLSNSSITATIHSLVDIQLQSNSSRIRWRIHAGIRYLVFFWPFVSLTYNAISCSARNVSLYRPSGKQNPVNYTVGTKC